MWWRDLSPGEVLLIFLCLPAILMALWVGCLHHNAGRGAAALRWALLPRGQRPGAPVFLAGTAAGATLWVGFAALAGLHYFIELIAAPGVWAVILLPDLVWLASVAPTLTLVAVRRLAGIPVGRSSRKGAGYDPADAALPRQHAFG